MKISIGEAGFATKRPKDLDAALLASTGCNAAEVGRLLSGAPSAATVARALLPFLEGEAPPPMAELAAAIAVAGVADVAAQVAALYLDAAAPPPPPPPPPSADAKPTS